ncbi:MAG: hypothetical protein O3B65_00485 [Chloroflexi bacterium]|nr:hypothetical protein [Chloroflexota bacterium]
MAIVNRYLAPVPGGAQVIYDGSRTLYDLMLPRAEYEGTLNIVLAAGNGETDEFGRANICGVEVVTYELKGELNYVPLGDIWGAELALTGMLTSPLPKFAEELPQTLDISATSDSDGIDRLRMYSYATDGLQGALDSVGFVIGFYESEPNPGSTIDDESTCFSYMDVHAILAFPGDDTDKHGPITGRVLAAPGSGSRVTGGKATLEGISVSQTVAIDGDGRFTFPEVSTLLKWGDGWIQPKYAITISEATGPGTFSIHGTTTVTFETATVEDVYGLTTQEITLDLDDKLMPTTHFIAVGDRGVGGAPIVYHYSLEYWECGGDFAPLSYTDGFTPTEIIAECKGLDPAAQPEKLGEIELLARTGWEVWAGAENVLDPGKTWITDDVWIAEIMYSDTTAEDLMPIFTGTAKEVEERWNTITGLAQSYPWAEQPGFTTTSVFTQWPRSLYEALQTNSNTFVRYLVTESGLTMTEMDGSHPGSDTPSLNSDTDFSRSLVYYSVEPPWKDEVQKAEPSGTPP